MSLIGLKKQINKANQYVSEKIGGARGTELDDEFTKMERKVDAMGRLADELMNRTLELLQPNPASRARMVAVKSISKLRGHSGHHSLYQQPEGLLAECMIKYGRELGEDSLYGQSLVEVGESYRQLAEVKYIMEDNVRQNFVEPLQHLQNKDLKEVNFHRKKLQGRRLDFDCKKRKQGGAALDEEIHAAEEKFEESKMLTETAMRNLLENDPEQLSQLCLFIEAELTYHQQAAEQLQSLFNSVQVKCEAAANRPRDIRTVNKLSLAYSSLAAVSDSDVTVSSDVTHASSDVVSDSDVTVSSSPRAVSDIDVSTEHENNHDVTETSRTSTTDGCDDEQQQQQQQPCAQALYDFEAQNDGELGFKVGDVIQLTSRLDDNWFEGTLGGREGYFPVNYVNVLVDLPTI